MRTKTLICAAAIAAAAVTSVMAQSNVYSLNIVGYANVDMPTTPLIYANPFSTGVSNGANEVLTTLPDGSLVSRWNGSAFLYSYFDNSLGISANGWYQSDGVTPSTPPILAPGTGFFLSPGSHFTNTFVGNVVPAPGTTNTVAYGANNNLVGSRLPVALSVTNKVFNLPLNDGMLLQKWTGSAYQYFYYDNSLGISADGWYQADGVTPGPVPAMAVAQGFFYNPGGSVNWSQTITNSP